MFSHKNIGKIHWKAAVESSIRNQSHSASVNFEINYVDVRRWSYRVARFLLPYKHNLKFQIKRFGTVYSFAYERNWSVDVQTRVQTSSVFHMIVLFHGKDKNWKVSSIRDLMLLMRNRTNTAKNTVKRLSGRYKTLQASQTINIKSQHILKSVFLDELKRF